MLYTTYRSRNLPALLFPIHDTPGDTHNTHPCIRHMHMLESDFYDNGAPHALSAHYRLTILGTISHPIPILPEHALGTYGLLTLCPFSARRLCWPIDGYLHLLLHLQHTHLLAYMFRFSHRKRLSLASSEYPIGHSRY
jgi:hypothetical protein